MAKTKFDGRWLIFFSILLLLSPLKDGGETYETALWLRLWIMGFGCYYFFKPLSQGKLVLRTPIRGWLILGIFLCLTASFLFTRYYYFTIYWYFYFFCYLLLFLICLNLFSGERGKELTSAVWLLFLLCGLLESIFGVFQYIKESPDRVSGSFFNPAYYAGYLAGLFAFPLSDLVFKIGQGSSGRGGFTLRIGSAVLCGLIFFALVLSASRSIIFVLMPLGLVLLIRFRYFALLVILALLLGLAVIPNPLRTRMLNLKQDPYAWERIQVWRTSLKIIRHHPQGVGLGMYKYYYSRYAYPLKGMKYSRYGKQTYQSHNEFLNFAVECSLLAPIFALGFLLIIFRRAFRALKGSSEPLLRAQLAGFSGSLLAILSHSLVDFNLHQPPIMVMAIIDLSALLSLLSQRDPQLIKKREWIVRFPRRVWIPSLLSLILISLLVSYQTLFIGLVSYATSEKNRGEAVFRLESLTRFPSGYAPLYGELGRIYLQNAQRGTKDLRRVSQAINYLNQALRLNPMDYEYYYDLASCHYFLGSELHTPGMIEDARIFVENAIKWAPSYVFNYLLLSDIYLWKKDYQSAGQALRTALNYEPYFLKARAQLIWIWAYQGRREEAKGEREILLSQYQELKEFEEAHPKFFNPYQKLVVELKEEELRKLLSLEL